MGEDVFTIKRSGAVDLLTGTPWKKLLHFAVPLFIGNLFQQLYNTVDTIIVGRWVGHVALAAVGVSSPILFFLVSIFMGVAMGSSVLVAQYYGARNAPALRKTLHTAIMLALLVGVMLSVIGFVFSPAVLRLLNTPEDTYNQALTYARILFSGIVGQMIYNMTSGFMRGQGNSRMPVIILIVSSVLNIILDLVFIIPLHMGVAGAAWATIISQFISGVIAVYALHRTSPLTRISLKELKIDWYQTKEIFKIGIPTACQQAILSLGGMIIMSFITTYGTTTIAGYSAAMKVDMIAVMPIMSFSMAMTAYTGQNIGAARMDRVYLGAKQGFTLLAIVTVVLSSVLLIFGKQILMLFTDNVPTIEAGYRMMRTVVPFYLLMATIQTLGGVMRGAGATVIPMINAIVMNIVARIPLVILLNNLMHNADAVYWSQVGGWAIGGIHMFISYNQGKWKQKAFERIELLHPELKT
jgi:putative MATE family efflux protein